MKHVALSYLEERTLCCVSPEYLHSAAGSCGMLCIGVMESGTSGTTEGENFKGETVFTKKQYKSNQD